MWLQTAVELCFSLLAPVFIDRFISQFVTRPEEIVANSPAFVLGEEGTSI